MRKENEKMESDKGYSKRVIEHFKNGSASDEDWKLLGKAFFEMSVWGSKSGEISLAELNNKIKKGM